MGLPTLGQKDPPGGGNGDPPQYSRLGNPHGQRSLAGYSPWDHGVGHDSSGARAQELIYNVVSVSGL